MHSSSHSNFVSNCWVALAILVPSLAEVVCLVALVVALRGDSLAWAVISSVIYAAMRIGIRLGDVFLPLAFSAGPGDFEPHPASQRTAALVAAEVDKDHG
jgi:hypothetical protein